MKIYTKNRLKYLLILMAVFSFALSSAQDSGYKTYTYEDGAKYVGEFKDGNFNGQGTLTYASGGMYVGEFKDDKRDGQGTLTYANGDKYVGEFKADNFNGQGTYTYANGIKYVGEFKDGNFNGQGTMTYENGSQESGLWANDKFVSATTGSTTSTTTTTQSAQSADKGSSSSSSSSSTPAVSASSNSSTQSQIKENIAYGDDCSSMAIKFYNSQLQSKAAYGAYGSSIDLSSSLASLLDSFEIAKKFYKLAYELGSQEAKRKSNELDVIFQQYCGQSSQASTATTTFQSSRTPARTTQSYEDQCPSCLGFRFKPNFAPYGGRGPVVYCAKCGRTDTTHDHDVCSRCKGAGTITRTKLSY